MTSTDIHGSDHPARDLLGPLQESLAPLARARAGVVAADPRDHVHHEAPPPTPQGHLSVDDDGDGDPTIWWTAGDMAPYALVFRAGTQTQRDGFDALARLVTHGNSFKAGYGAAQQFYGRTIAQLTAELEGARAELDTVRDTLHRRTEALSRVTADNTPDPDVDGTPAGGQS